MTFEEVQKLVLEDEGRRLELKKSTGELKDGMHSACALLNSDGGYLLFGITPKSLEVVGQQVTDATKREIAQAISGLEPAIDVKVDYIDVPNSTGNKVVVMYFDGWVWGKPPYTYHGCPYYKPESITKQMPREMFEERLKAAKPHLFGWENQIADEYSISDLSEKQILNAVRMGVRGGRMPESALSLSTEDILKHLSLLKDGKPIQAAVVLFCDKLHYTPQLKLRMARFKGINKNEFFDSQNASGCFFDLLDAGMSFCFKHLNLHGKVIGLNRVEDLDIPVEALREALINALCHRSYESISGSVSLAIYDDRVEIENPGRLPLDITPDNIKESHDSKPYNPTIAGVLYKTTWLESWGSGVARMVQACKAKNIPEPYYEVRPGGVAIVFRFKDINNESNSNQNCELDCEANCELKLSDRHKVILSILMSDGEKTASWIASQLGLGLRSIQSDLSYLRNNGFIKKASKSTHSAWIVLKKS